MTLLFALQPSQIIADRPLGLVIARFIIACTHQFIGQILLLYIMVRIVVGIFVLRAGAEALVPDVDLAAGTLTILDRPGLLDPTRADEVRP